MEIVTIDFETYYDKQFSLSRMTTESYVRDSRFEVIGVGVKIGDNETDFYSGSDVNEFLNSIRYDDKAILCHNTAFDGAILSWHYGVKPKLWLDTLSMARPYHQMTVGGSLKALAGYYGLGAKGTEVENNIGKRRKDFTEAEMNAYADYCIQDVELTYNLFKKLVKGFPTSELMVIDQTLRMYTEPSIKLDYDVLESHLLNEKIRKEKLLTQLGGGEEAKKIIMSNPKFATLLTKLGATPPMKISAKTGKAAYAFAKTDAGLKKLLSHPKRAVRMVTETRLGIKSTIEQTRTEAFMGISKRGLLPIMLNYYGAHTGRFSGGDKVNLQNLPRGGQLRRAITAPEGKVLVACDSSQIEARVVAYLAGQTDLVNAFRKGDDVYSLFATDVYSRQISKADKVERHVGKTAILGLGYGMGAAKFLDTMVSGFIPVDMDDNEAARIVSLYRNKNSNIVNLWRTCGTALAGLQAKNQGDICSLISYDNGRIRLPNGLHMQYPLLRHKGNNYEYVNNARSFRSLAAAKLQNAAVEVPWTKIYGGKVVENITQAVARIVVSEQMVAIGRRYNVAFQVHDEVVCVVDEDEAETCRDYLVGVMSTPPVWAHDLPVACEADIGANYGEAK